VRGGEGARGGARGRGARARPDTAPTLPSTTLPSWTGIAKSLRQKGVKEGDAVRVGGAEFAWSDDRSDGALYDAWMAARKASGRVLQGGSRWPHGGG